MSRMQSLGMTISLLSLTALAGCGGDEAVAYQLTGAGTRRSWFTVVRRGSAVVLFPAATGRAGAGGGPADLVTTQIAKLDKALDWRGPALPGCRRPRYGTT
jgi:hypothetical protein